MLTTSQMSPCFGGGRLRDDVPGPAGRWWGPQKLRLAPARSAFDADSHQSPQTTTRGDRRRPETTPREATRNHTRGWQAYQQESKDHNGGENPWSHTLCRR